MCWPAALAVTEPEQRGLLPRGLPGQHGVSGHPEELLMLENGDLVVRGAGVEVGAGRRVVSVGRVVRGESVVAGKQSTALFANADINGLGRSQPCGRGGRPARAVRDALHMGAGDVADNEGDVVPDQDGCPDPDISHPDRSAERLPVVRRGVQQRVSVGDVVAASVLKHGNVTCRGPEHPGDTTGSEGAAIGSGDDSFVRALALAKVDRAHHDLARAAGHAVRHDRGVSIKRDAASRRRAGDPEGLVVGLRISLDPARRACEGGAGQDSAETQDACGAGSKNGSSTHDKTSSARTMRNG